MAAKTYPAPAGPRLASLIWTGAARREAAIALLLVAAVFSAVQSGTSNIIGLDGYYHIKVAALMREHGPRLDFPWLQLSILGPERYADHHFLFHAFQVPFTFGDLRTGAKMAAVLFAAAGLYISYAFLSRQQIRYPLLWLIVALGASQSFLWRQSMARPQSIFLALMVLALWAVLQRRPVLLIPLGFTGTWLFDGFPLLLAAPIAAVGAILGLGIIALLMDGAALEQWRVAGRRDLALAVAGLAAAVLGIALGLVTHPYFPRNVEFAILHLLPKAQVGMEVGARVGGEWYPFTPMGFVVRAGPATLLCLLGFLPPLIALTGRRLPDWRTITLGAAALLLLAMTARSQRIIEYFPAIATLFCAWSWSREPFPLPGAIAAFGARAGRAGVVALALVLSVGLLWTVGQARRDTRLSQDWQAYQEPAQWLSANTPAGARIFTASWDEFPRLFFWNSHNTYLAGLDPTYMVLYDEKLFTTWRRLASGRVTDPAKVIGDSFGSEYAFIDRRHGTLLQRAQSDRGMETVFESPAAVIFRIVPSTS